VIPGELRQCPECGHGWPKDPDHALRGCAWLYGLPRKVSPSNNELLIHDGTHGSDRFLQFEIKSPSETWPPPAGQSRTLVALAGQTNWTVRILRGTTHALEVHRVTRAGIETSGIRSHVEAVRQAVVTWLGGALWRDAEAKLTTSGEDLDHVHGWARLEGIWTCVQDYHAGGIRPDTSCGLRLPSTLSESAGNAGQTGTKIESDPALSEAALTAEAFPS
jgi:hypothetical protein